MKSPLTNRERFINAAENFRGIDLRPRIRNKAFLAESKTWLVKTINEHDYRADPYFGESYAGLGEPAGELIAECWEIIVRRTAHPKLLPDAKFFSARDVAQICDNLNKKRDYPFDADTLTKSTEIIFYTLQSYVGDINTFLSPVISSPGQDLSKAIPILALAPILFDKHALSANRAKVELVFGVSHKPHSTHFHYIATHCWDELVERAKLTEGGVITNRDVSRICQKINQQMPYNAPTLHSLDEETLTRLTKELTRLLEYIARDYPRIRPSGDQSQQMGL